MASGKIKWFDSKRGYGFIAHDSGKDIFVHYSCILGQGYKMLEEGDMVEYELVDGEKGPKAENVKRVARGNPSPPPARSAPSSPPRSGGHSHSRYNSQRARPRPSA